MYGLEARIFPRGSEKTMKTISEDNRSLGCDLKCRCREFETETQHLHRGARYLHFQVMRGCYSFKDIMALSPLTLSRSATHNCDDEKGFMKKCILTFHAAKLYRVDPSRFIL